MLSVYADFENLEMDFKKLTREIYDVIDEQAENFFVDLIDRNPVDTGKMKASWQTSSASFSGEWVWKARNAADYADIITVGRRQVGNRWYGSIKGWGVGGVEPMLQKMSNDIFRRTNDIKI